MNEQRTIEKLLQALRQQQAPTVQSQASEERSFEVERVVRDRRSSPTPQAGSRVRILVSVKQNANDNLLTSDRDFYILGESSTPKKLFSLRVDTEDPSTTAFQSRWKLTAVDSTVKNCILSRSVIRRSLSGYVSTANFDVWKGSRPLASLSLSEYSSWARELAFLSGIEPYPLYDIGGGFFVGSRGGSQFNEYTDRFNQQKQPGLYRMTLNPEESITDIFGIPVEFLGEKQAPILLLNRISGSSRKWGFFDGRGDYTEFGGGPTPFIAISRWSKLPSGEYPDEPSYFSGSATLNASTSIAHPVTRTIQLSAPISIMPGLEKTESVVGNFSAPTSNGLLWSGSESQTRYTPLLLSPSGTEALYLRSNLSMTKQSGSFQTIFDDTRTLVYVKKTVNGFSEVDVTPDEADFPDFPPIEQYYKAVIPFEPPSQLERLHLNKGKISSVGVDIVKGLAYIQEISIKSDGKMKIAANPKKEKFPIPSSLSGHKLKTNQDWGEWVQFHAYSLTP